MAIRKMTREEYFKQYGVEPFSTVSSPNVNPAPPEEFGTVGDFGVGALKGVASTAHGLDELTRKIPVLKQIQETFNPRKESYQKTSEKLTTATNTAQKIGKGAEQIAEYFIPGTLGLKAAKGAKLATKVGMGALETGVVGTAQSGSVKEGFKAAAVGGGLPVVGKALKPVTNLVGRLLRGVGTGLSGMSSKQLQAVLDNPKAAQSFVKEINKSGGAKLLRKEADDIVQGVSTIRQQARKTFGEGLEQLSKEEIPKINLKKSLQPIIEKYGIASKDGVLKLKNVEFSSPINLTKAKELITKVNSFKDLNGKALRKLTDDIEHAAYKITGGESEKSAFNVFVRDLGKSVENSITSASPRLQQMKKAFSQEMQLVEEVEKIFGKVKFKNAKEVLNVSQKLESLFTQKGLAPETVDKFLTRIGIEPSVFKAGEAVRQAGELAEKSNTIGTNPFEIIRGITSAIVPPKMVRDIAIQTGLAENVVKEIAEKLSPAARGALFRLILGNVSENGQDVNNP